MKKTCLILLGVFILLMVISGLLSLIFKHPVPFEQDLVALIRIEGPILDSRDAIEEIKEFSKDTGIKAIVLRVDSPGGAVAPSQEIYGEVRKAVEKKPVVISMGSVAASGAYYISAPSSKIVANPGTLTGSIGVIMEIPNLSGLMKKIGVESVVIKSGKHKDLASVFRGIGKEERKILQGVLDDVHKQFIEAVAEGRKMEPSAVAQIADGRVFTGKQAVQVGLVDELGNIEDAILVAANLAGIEGEPKVVTKEKKKSVLDLLRGKFSGKMNELFSTIELKYILTP